MTHDATRNESEQEDHDERMASALLRSARRPMSHQNVPDRRRKRWQPPRSSPLRPRAIMMPRTVNGTKGQTPSTLSDASALPSTLPPRLGCLQRMSADQNALAAAASPLCYCLVANEPTATSTTAMTEIKPADNATVTGRPRPANAAPAVNNDNRLLNHDEERISSRANQLSSRFPVRSGSSWPHSLLHPSAGDGTQNFQRHVR